MQRAKSGEHNGRKLPVKPVAASSPAKWPADDRSAAVRSMRRDGVAPRANVSRDGAIS